MRSRNLVMVLALIVLISALFSTNQVSAARKTASLDGHVRGPDFSKVVPGNLNYQGFLVDAADSVAITDTLQMTFRLYDSEIKGMELWSEIHPAVPVSNGLFHVLLGSVTPFPGDLFDGSSMWLQTEVGAEVLAPRKPLVSVAYGMRAQEADHAAMAHSATYATEAYHAIQADTAAYTQVAGMTAADSAVVADDAHQLEGQNLADLDARYMNEADLDHLDAADGHPANAVYVDTAGNVGVGTTTPGAKLDVSGDVNTDSLYKIGGKAVISASGAGNISVGVGAGANNTGDYVTFVGDNAGYNNQSNSSTFIGHDAGYSNTWGYRNTFLGFRAGYSNTYHDNTFLGYYAGYSNTTGNHNIFIGCNAGYFNTEGSGNLFLGNRAGHSNITGYNNIFLGHDTGQSNTTGIRNTFLGRVAGVSNTTGGHNAFLGFKAGYSNTTGSLNTFLGTDVGYSNTTGEINTFVGVSAGYYNTDGSRNTFVGSNAGWSNQMGDDNVFIGYQAGFYETGSNKLYIANGLDTSNVVIYGDFSTGNVGLGTLSPARRLHVSDVMRLEPRDSAPGSPSEGDMYMDSTTHKLMVYDGTTWQACW